MTTHAWIAAGLLGAAVALCILCSLGVLVMRDAFQRLHFPTTVVSLAAALIATAIFVEDPGATVRVKAVIIVILLFFMNGVLSHVTARAAHIQRTGRWKVEPSDGIPLHGGGKKAGR